MAGSGPIEQYFDPDNIDRQRAELVQITRCKDFPSYEGRNLLDISSELGRPVDDITRSIITAPRAAETLCIIFEIDEGDMRTVLSHPLAMIGSDRHPSRRWCSPSPPSWHLPARHRPLQPRRRSIRSDHAVTKMTGCPADRYGLLERGRIQLGTYADIVVFDHSRIADKGSYQQRRQPEGIKWVLVNGRPAVTPRGLTHSNSGTVLSRTTT